MKLPPRKFSLIAATLLIVATAGILLFFKPTPTTLPPQIPAAPSMAPAKNPAPQQPELILDLFEPIDDSLAAQHSAATLSGQIEHALVVSFLLTKCNLITQQEYSDTYNALITYAARTHLAPDIQSAATRVKTIASAAGASYSLVYSRVPCGDPSLPPLVTSLAQWRSVLTHGER